MTRRTHRMGEGAVMVLVLMGMPNAGDDGMTADAAVGARAGARRTGSAVKAMWVWIVEAWWAGVTALGA